MSRSIFICIVAIAGLVAGCANSIDSNATTATTRTSNGALQGGGSVGAATPAPSPTVSPSPTPLPAGEESKGPADVIYEYYASINSKDFRPAYELWSENGAASKKTFEQFRDGFKNTERTEVIIGKVGEEEGAAGSRYITIPVAVKAKTIDGRDQTFTGQYVLRRSVVDGATEDQRKWQIYSAKLRQTSG